MNGIIYFTEESRSKRRSYTGFTVNSNHAIIRNASNKCRYFNGANGEGFLSSLTILMPVFFLGQWQRSIPNEDTKRKPTTIGIYVKRLRNHTKTQNALYCSLSFLFGSRSCWRRHRSLLMLPLSSLVTTSYH